MQIETQNGNVAVHIQYVDPKEKTVLMRLDFEGADVNAPPPALTAAQRELLMDAMPAIADAAEQAEHKFGG